MPPSPRQHAIALLRWVRGASEMFLKDFPQDRFTFQPSKTDNHASWVLGHLASTDVWLASELKIPGVTIPESWSKVYGQGSKPVNDAAAYPKPAEVRAAFDKTRAAILAWLDTAPDSALTGDLKEKTGGFATDPIDMLLKIAWHEGWHMGQLASIRKALGLPSVLG